MPLPLTSKEVAERLRNYPRDNYLYIGSIVKGTALAAATLVALAIFSDLRTHWPRIAPWFASLMAITVSYMTWGRGVLLTNARSNLLDSIFPLMMGLVEFLLFGLLLPDKERPFLWHHWFSILGLHSLLAVLLIQNRLKNTILEEDFSPNLFPLGLELVKWLRKDQIGAGIATVSSLIIWLAMITVGWPYLGPPYADLTHTVLAGLAGILLLLPILSADHQRHYVDKFVSTLFIEGDPVSKA